MLVDIYIEDFEHFMDQEWKSNYDQFEINLRNFLRIYQNGYLYHIVYKNKNFLELIGMKMDTEQGLCTEPHVDALLKELEQTFHFRATYMIRQEYDNIYQIKKLRKQMRNETNEMCIRDRYLHLRDNLLALILPSLINVFHVIMVRTFFMQLPESLFEAAKMDAVSYTHLDVYKRQQEPCAAIWCWTKQTESG